MLYCITSKHEVKNSWQSKKEMENTKCWCACWSAEGLTLRCIFVSDFICPEDFSSQPALKQSCFRYLLLAGCLIFPLYHLGSSVTSTLGCLMPGNSCSLSPESSGCSPCAHRKLRRAGARQGLFPRWQEQVDKCPAGLPNSPCSRWDRHGGVPSPLETGPAPYFCYVRKTAK